MKSDIETRSERVLIVGGSSGMGFALAASLLADKAEVTIVGRSESRLTEARARLPNAERLRTIAADFTQEEQVARLFERSGPLDHIVTTAADIEGAYQLLPLLQINAARKVVDSKFIGPLLLAKYGAPVLFAERIDHLHFGDRSLSSGRARFGGRGDQWRARVPRLRAGGRTRADPR